MFYPNYKKQIILLTNLVSWVKPNIIIYLPDCIGLFGRA